MAAIQASKAGAPIYNIMQLYTCTDLIAVASYANSALDSLTTTWCAKNNESKYKNSSIFKKARNKMKKYILESKSIQLKEKFIDFLTPEVEDQEIVQDVTARLSFASQPSAHFKLRLFLTSHDLYPKENDKAAFLRLKSLNTLRNSVSHSGDIPKDKELTFERSLEISAGITALTVEIAQYFIAVHILKLDVTLCNSKKEDIRSFFETGMYRGQDTFGETYNDYIARTSKAWIENGDFGYY